MGEESSEEKKQLPKRHYPCLLPQKYQAISFELLSLVAPSKALHCGLATSRFWVYIPEGDVSTYLHLFGLLLEGLLVDLQLLSHLWSRLPGQDVLQLQVKLLLLLDQQLLLHHLLRLLDQALLQRVDFLDHLIC